MKHITKSRLDEKNDALFVAVVGILLVVSTVFLIFVCARRLILKHKIDGT